MIWFKNAQVYRFSETVAPEIELWQEQMKQHLWAPCQQQQPVSLGWVSAIPDAETLIHTSGEFWLLCLQRQERLLPGPVVREVLQEKVETIQSSEDRRVGSKERQTLKDEVIFSLLPKAFVRTSRHYLMIDLKQRLLIVDAASESRADEVTSFLRESLGSLPLTLLQSHCQPSAILTQWIVTPDDIAPGWELLPDLELTQSSNNDIKVRLKNLELDSESIASHIEQDGRVIQIAVNWQDRVEAIITAKSQIKRIRFADLITEQAMDQSDDDKYSQFDASFTLMANELSQLVAEMMKQFSVTEGPV